MEVTIYRNILTKTKERGVDSRLVYKTYKSDVIPHKGDFIYDTAFKDPTEIEVASVILDYSGKKCDIWLNAFEIKNGDLNNVIEWVKVYQMHDWECNFLV